ncbi:Fe-S-containing hydro-lyase [Desulfobacca acetoxidans]|uniref:Hydro-lyase, Fe-S type, tartrate/fumarate subfamily, beta subunit n=1 Tax=Desulfobacca acetoxidans (strain ATCC 700848 / DSM 11109 / ASRB2) TaxID=880072 RepID=F2NJL2_DESAR|nr:Fe-S-containing hydro-lyase [Desulfobacca acetoxidans]AEB09524.1 hydro-lyase, Fe-S type, tartrate/fumarate subfamily, beta subunit [Desulfobacca acetoxidans DSM 11109]
MPRTRRLTTPLSDQDVEALEIGDNVLVNGVIYTARDAAHKRLIDLLEAGQPLPVDLRGQVMFYVGPSPARPGRVIGAAGPTTSYRMDPYAPQLLRLGLKAMIGKGRRSQEVIDAMVACKAVYLGAIGGAGALISQSIKAAEIVAYEDLGPEAIRRLVVEDLPTIVINDCQGNDFYDVSLKRYARR